MKPPSVSTQLEHILWEMRENGAYELFKPLFDEVYREIEVRQMDLINKERKDI